LFWKQTPLALLRVSGEKKALRGEQGVPLRAGLEQQSVREAVEQRLPALGVL
jgi:hypothetical protein